MKLPGVTLTTEQKLLEFDVWITPYLGDIRPRKGVRHYERRHRQNGPLPVSSVQDDFTLLSWKGT